ncbi:hypothetical protein HK102_013386 [Quaeritorhiza haematococci]|nr:hypothetical protein HK102_013386 [Quaeritorhiza haematococci]
MPGGGGTFSEEQQHDLSPGPGGSGDGDNSLAGKKRKRVTQACDACNKKKVKCDGEKPACSNCVRASIPCSYFRGAKKRGPRPGYIESLENRLKEMEAVLEIEAAVKGGNLDQGLMKVAEEGSVLRVVELVDKDGSSSSEGMVSGSGGRPNSAKKKKSKHRHSQQVPRVLTSTSSINLPVGLQSGASGGSMLSSPMSALSGASSSQLGLEPQDHNVFAEVGVAGDYSRSTSGIASTSRPITSGLSSATLGGMDLPPSVVDELIELYFDYIYPIMPMTHRKTFLANLPNTSPLLLNAMFALAARYCTNPAIITPANGNALFSAGDPFYIRARELVDHFMDVPSLSTVEALLLLATYAAGSGRGSAAWMYSGMAIRMAQELKLNVEPEFDESFATANHNPTWLEKEIRRRLWWNCFVLDRYAGAAADRSMIINEKDCKVYLFSTELAWRTVSSYDEVPVVGNSRAGAMIGGHGHVNGSSASSSSSSHMAALSSSSNVDSSYQIAVLTSTNPFTPGVPLENPMGYFILLIKIFGKIVEYTNVCKHQQQRHRGGTGKGGGGEGGMGDGGSGAGTASLMSSLAVGGGVGAVTSASAFAKADNDIQLSMLDASLREWFNALPEWIRVLGERFPHDVYERYVEYTRASHANGEQGAGGGAPQVFTMERPADDPAWLVAYLHVFYHTCVVMLHRPKMMEKLWQYTSSANQQQQPQQSNGKNNDTTSSPAQPPSLGSPLRPTNTPTSNTSGNNAANPALLHSSPSFVVCSSSANSICSILEKVMSTNPSFRYFSPFVGFCIFQSGLIHILTMQTCVGSNSNGTGTDVSSDGGGGAATSAKGKGDNNIEATFAVASRRAEVHVKALSGMSVYWFMSGRLHAVLKNLYESCKAHHGGGANAIGSGYAAQTAGAAGAGGLSTEVPANGGENRPGSSSEGATGMGFTGNAGGDGSRTDGSASSAAAVGIVGMGSNAARADGVGGVPTPGVLGDQLSNGVGYRWLDESINNEWMMHRTKKRQQEQQQAQSQSPSSQNLQAPPPVGKPQQQGLSEQQLQQQQTPHPQYGHQAYVPQQYQAPPPPPQQQQQPQQQQYQAPRYMSSHPSISSADSSATSTSYQTMQQIGQHLQAGSHQQHQQQTQQQQQPQQHHLPPAPPSQMPPSVVRTKTTTIPLSLMTGVAAAAAATSASAMGGMSMTGSATSGTGPASGSSRIPSAGIALGSAGPLSASPVEYAPSSASIQQLQPSPPSGPGAPPTPVAAQTLMQPSPLSPVGPMISPGGVNPQQQQQQQSAQAQPSPSANIAVSGAPASTGAPTAPIPQPSVQMQVPLVPVVSVPLLDVENFLDADFFNVDVTLPGMDMGMSMGMGMDMGIGMGMDIGGAAAALGMGMGMEMGLGGPMSAGITGILGDGDATPTGVPGFNMVRQQNQTTQQTQATPPQHQQQHQRVERRTSSSSSSASSSSSSVSPPTSSLMASSLYHPSHMHGAAVQQQQLPQSLPQQQQMHVLQQQQQSQSAHQAHLQQHLHSQQPQHQHQQPPSHPSHPSLLAPWPGMMPVATYGSSSANHPPSIQNQQQQQQQQQQHLQQRSHSLTHPPHHQHPMQQAPAPSAQPMYYTGHTPTTATTGVGGAYPGGQPPPPPQQQHQQHQQQQRHQHQHQQQQQQQHQHQQMHQQQQRRY